MPILTNFAIILVCPQMGENIGSVARNMKNFGLSDLRIVSPRDGWPNQNALAVAKHAADIVENALVVKTLPEAITDLNHLYATTTRQRQLRQEVISCHNLNEFMPLNGKIGFLFGRENSGLYNNEIDYANKIVTIDSALNDYSLNLGQAAGIICYELYKSTLQNIPICKAQPTYPASAMEIEHFTKILLTHLQSSDFFRKCDNIDNTNSRIKGLIKRIDGLSKSDIKLMHGILKALAK